MKKVRTHELIGRALDWAVADALGKKPEMRGQIPCCNAECATGKEPIPKWSSSVACGEQLIDRSRISVGETPMGFVATIMTSYGSATMVARDRRVAACRALVAARLGSITEVPEALA